jgi:hypothetical protein
VRFGRPDCNCADCLADRGLGRRAKESPADLARVLGAKEGARWFARLAGREAKEKLDVELERWFAEPGSAARTLRGLSPECRVALALLVEAPAGSTVAELEMELVELGGEAFAGRALAELGPAGLLFTIGRGRPQSPRVDLDSWLLLPAPLRSWLAPVTLPLLLGSAEPPPESAADSPGASAAREPEDPGLASAIGIAALRTVGARTTGQRLYKKDRDRVEALTGAPDADELARALAAQRFVRVSRESGAPVEARWPAIERWAARPAAARAADDLARRHGATLPWQTLVDARGGWVEEIHLARRARLVTSSAYARGKPDRERRRQVWARERLVIQGWPEVELGQHDRRTFFRLRPEVAASLRAEAGRRVPGRIFAQPDFEVLVPRDAGLGAALLLARVARLLRADVVLTFKLTPDSIRQAVLEGLPAQRIIAELGALAAHGVPAAVERAVHDWAGNVGRCTVGTATVVRFDDESLAARAAQALGAAAERVGPTTLVISDDEARDPEALLEKAGFPPRAEAAEDAEDEDLDDASEDPFGEDDEGEDAERPAGDAGIAHGDQVAATLGLDTTGDRRSLDGGLLRELANEIRAARTGVRGAVAGGGRSGELGAGPGPAGSAAASLSRRAATNPASIAKLLLRAAAADADVVLLLTDGSDHQVRLLAPTPGAAGNSVRVRFAATGVERPISVATIASALALFATSRRVSRNQPCPCGSDRKFKRCCAESDAERSGASDGDGGALERPIG